MQKKLILLLLVYFYGIEIHAQSDNTFTGWGAVFASYKLNDKFSIHFDGQLRTTDELKQVQSFIIRPGLNFNLSKNVIITLGYAYIGNRRVMEGVADMVPEHRIWQQFIYNKRFDVFDRSSSLQHRFRLEERFIGKAYVDGNFLSWDEYEFSLRLRYFARAILPLTKTDNFTSGSFISLQDEIFVNIDNAPTLTNGKFFDQNRAYMSIGWRFSPMFDIETGYMWQFINGSTNDLNNNIIQIAAYLRM